MNRKERRAIRAAGGWLPLQRAVVTPKTPRQIAAIVPELKRLQPDITEAEIRSMFERLTGQEVWKNELYQVHVERHAATEDLPPLVHLSIRRIDRGHVFDWRHMQLIKNQLVGAECEGVELFPAESRLVDLANQRHVFVIADPEFQFPFGFDGGRAVDDHAGGGAKQRPRRE